MGQLPVSRDERGATPTPPHRRDDDAAVLPEVSRDETSEGWGDEQDARDEEWYRRERPPHHD
jgi:hypothetical protein